MKTSRPVLAVTLFAIAASGYAGIGSAGPHGGAAGFHATSGGRFGINGIMGTGRGIMGTGATQGIMGTGRGIKIGRASCRERVCLYV